MEKSETTTQSTRPPRRKLISRSSDGLTPSPKSVMRRAYNEVYRQNLIRNGCPERRQLGEAMLQAVIEELTGPVPTYAKQITERAASILRSVVDKNGVQVFRNEGIKLRIAKVAAEMSPLPSGKPE